MSIPFRRQHFKNIRMPMRRSKGYANGKGIFIAVSRTCSVPMDGSGGFNATEEEGLIVPRRGHELVVQNVDPADLWKAPHCAGDIAYNRRKRSVGGLAVDVMCRCLNEVTLCLQDTVTVGKSAGKLRRECKS